MKYRPDIDGLRAVAVIPVVLFHLDLPPFSGGFVGVDVFFVISGFLITSIILDELDKGRFTLAGFYERRARRILPSLLAVMAASTIAAAILFMPQPLLEFSQSLIATAFFSSNFLFWQQTGYFDAPAELKPLLHTWSLAIEEQFYVFYPLILLTLIRFFWKRWVIGVFLLGLASFVVSVWAVRRIPEAAFYLLPFRGWELLLGALLASSQIPNLKARWQAEAVAAIGFALILWPMVTYSEATRFPGLAAAVPCLGAAFIIYAGRSAYITSVARCLQIRPLVYVGLISYSLYLWHWPIIVFYKYWTMTPPGLIAKVAMIAAAVALASLSLHYLETPIRRKIAMPDRRMLASAIGACVVAVVGIGAWGTLSGGWPGRIEPAALALADETQYMHDRRDCHQAARKTLSQLCVRGAEGKEPDFILVGDSHGDAISPAIFAAAKAEGRAGYQFTNAGYRPAPGSERIGDSDNRFDRLTANLLALIKQSNIRDIYLYAYWDAGLKGRYRDQSGTTLPGSAALRRALSTLATSHPAIRFIFIEDNPASPRLSPHVAAQALHLGRPMATGLARADYEQQLDTLHPLFSVLAGLPNVTVVSIADALCSQAFCPSSAEGKPIYRDAEHLSPYGAMKLENIFRQLLSQRFPTHAGLH